MVPQTVQKIKICLHTGYLCVLRLDHKCHILHALIITGLSVLTEGGGWEELIRTVKADDIITLFLNH